MSASSKREECPDVLERDERRRRVVGAQALGGLMLFERVELRRQLFPTNAAGVSHSSATKRISSDRRPAWEHPVRNELRRHPRSSSIASSDRPSVRQLRICEDRERVLDGSRRAGCLTGLRDGGTGGGCSMSSDKRAQALRRTDER